MAPLILVAWSSTGLPAQSKTLCQSELPRPVLPRISFTERFFSPWQAWSRFSKQSEATCLQEIISQLSVEPELSAELFPVSPLPAITWSFWSWQVVRGGTGEGIVACSNKSCDLGKWCSIFLFQPVRPAQLDLLLPCRDGNSPACCCCCQITLNCCCSLSISRFPPVEIKVKRHWVPRTV